jgi:glycosyltransferase involved in cell wall biosynthesis
VISQKDNGHCVVSVLIPCRNEARFISRCLESILANECTAYDLEVLVVDGMSDDGTRDIVERYSRRNRGFDFWTILTKSLHTR